ncbi:MAG TPA: FtsX-like permease family protein [Terracidiphilus sp.]|nr:FtsX-like permease family protein [Terracidiphilus sp.]
MLRSLIAGIQALLRPSQRNAQIEEELSSFFESSVEDKIRRGMSSEEAQRIARIEIASREMVRHKTWSAGWEASVDSFARDLRLAFRQLKRSPGFAATAMLTLALGIGANTAIFLLTYSILLKGLPVPNPGQLIRYTFRKGDSEIGLSYGQYQALEQQQRVASGLFAWDMSDASLQIDGQSAKIPIAMATGSMFGVLDIRPALGRGFEPNAGEPGAPYVPEALLFWNYWHTVFQDDPSVIGKNLHLKGVFSSGGASVSIIGVLPRGFTGVQASHAPDLLLPLSFERVLHENAMIDHSSGSFWLIVMGRLRPGESVGRARANLASTRQIVNEAADPSHRFLNGGFFSEYHLDVESGHGGDSWLRFRFSRPLVALEALCGLMILLCGVNIALLVLSRVSGRLHEFAIRSALGATRRRLIFQVLTETLLLGLGSLLGGGVLGWELARMLVRMIADPESPIVVSLDFGTLVFLFAAAIGLGAALLAGVWPAWRASRSATTLDLRLIGSGRSTEHMGRWILPMQVALGVVLINAALLLAGTLDSYLQEHSGFSADHVLLAEVDFSKAGMQENDQATRNLEFLRQLQAMPGVQSAALMGIPPLSGGFSVTGYYTQDTSGNLYVNEHVWGEQVSKNYFLTMGTRILEGHGFTAADVSGDPTCVISAGAAAYFFPGQSAVGRFLNSGNGTGKPANLERCRVVGVVENARLASLLQPAPLAVYTPLEGEKRPLSHMYIAVRASNPQLAAAAVHETFARSFPGTPQPRTWLFRDAIDYNLSQQRLLSSVSGGFAVLALVLVATGLYGILARAVVDRRREIGIRMAFGAKRHQIVLTLTHTSAFRIGIGIIAGCVLAWLAGRLMQSLLYGVSATSPGIAAATLALLLAVLAVAFVLPARRAASVDPMEAIRDE